MQIRVCSHMTDLLMFERMEKLNTDKVLKANFTQISFTLNNAAEMANMNLVKCDKCELSLVCI